MTDRIAPLLAALVVLVGAAPSVAQDLSYRAAAGVAIPVSYAAESRGVGPAGMVSVEADLGRFWRLRLDTELSLLNGPPPPGDQDFTSYRDLRTLGASLSGVLAGSGGQVAPYVLAGLGAYWLQRVGAPTTPYGITAGVHAGFGIDIDVWDKVDPFVEARASLHLTDYGSEEFMPTIFWPVVVGVRVR